MQILQVISSMLVGLTMKEVNLNAFSEKLLHRYLLECYYGMLEDISPNSLLPERCHSKKINLIVPEMKMTSVNDNDEEYNVIPDLVIFFTDGTDLPIEVKWQSSGPYGKDQLRFLREKKGHIVSLVEDKKQKDITMNKIDFQHWQRWLGKRSMSLAMDTAISKGLDSEAGRQYWLVSPKGSQDSTTNYNYSRMRNLRSKKSDIHFWAFRNNAENVRNHLKIRKGDIVMFLMVNTRTLGLEKGHWLDDNPDYPLNVFRWVEYEVKIPYTIDIASDLSTFFEEDDSLNPGNRTWPHFIHLEKLEEGGNLTIKNRGNLSNHFRTSSSPGIRSGGPVRINFELYEELLDALRNEE